MSHNHLIQSPTRTRRQETRDLQARLYREIGLAAVAAELFAPEPSQREIFGARGDRAEPGVFRAKARAV